MVKKQNLNNYEKILKFILENNSNSFSIKQISEKLKIDYKNTHSAIEKIKDSITFNKVGKSKFIQFDFKLTPLVFKIEKFRLNDILKNTDLDLMIADIERISHPFIIILLFGSFIKKINTKYSDIDLCIISNNKSIKTKLIEHLKMFPLNLEMHEFTTIEFTSMLKSPENNLGKEIVKNNIILFGIENYYHLVSKWMNLK